MCSVLGIDVLPLSLQRYIHRDKSCSSAAAITQDVIQYPFSIHTSDEPTWRWSALKSLLSVSNQQSSPFTNYSSDSIHHTRRHTQTHADTGRHTQTYLHTLYCPHRVYTPWYMSQPQGLRLEMCMSVLAIKNCSHSLCISLLLKITFTVQ